MTRCKSFQYPGCLSFLFALLWIGAHQPAGAQDTRTVTEPVFPPVCTTLTAQLQQTGNTLPSGDETSFDTARIQDALNACTSGDAVELALGSASGDNAYLIQPITIPSGVTLLVDAGVTVYGSRNPADYAIASGSCGIVASSSQGCNALITMNAANAGIMGYGVIDGRGGQTLTSGANAGQTWWQLAYQAQQKSENQYNPQLLKINASNITLFKITFENSPFFHVTYEGTGFTAWDVKVIAPGDARNTDGIDPGPAQNVTITNSYIGDGDDNICLKPSESPGGGAAANMSITNNQFYVGHGMSIGSQTAGGASNVLVQNLNIDGDPTNSNDTGIRIKSESSNGGTISNVTYENVCMQNVASPIQFNPFYDSTTGTDYPQFQSVTLSNVTVLTAGKVLLEGYSATYPLGLTLNNVNFSTIASSNVSAENANVTLGPGPVNFSSYITGSNVNVTNDVANSEAPYSCSSSSFSLLAPELFGSAAQATPEQTLTLTAILEPAREPNWEGSTAGQYSSITAYYPVEPTGTVTFNDGSNQVGQVTLSGSSDIATLTLSSESAGTHNYTAVYSGDSNYAGITTPAFPVAVAYLPSATSLGVSATQIAQGSSVNLTATVTSTAGGTPTGTVEFFDGTSEIGTGQLNAGGIATLSTSSLPNGADSLTAQYESDGNYASSTSSAQTVNVGAFSTTTTLMSSVATANFGQSITLTATLASSGGTPTGTVTFMDGTTTLGAVTLSSGAATYQTTSLPAGSQSITASYIPSGNFAPSVSTPVTIEVQNFTISLSASTLNIAPGSSASTTFTFTGAGGVTGTISSVCGGLPAYITCSFSPPTATLSGNTATTVLTVSVASTLSGWLLPILPLMAFVPRRKKRRWHKAMLAIVIAAAGLALMTSCGGGGSGSGGGGTSQTPPAGQQTITITSTTTTAQGTLSNTAQLTVNVQ